MYVSPYRRTLHTLALLGLSPAWTVQEPRLREQDWGNLQDVDEQRRQKEEATSHPSASLRTPSAGCEVPPKGAKSAGWGARRPPAAQPRSNTSRAHASRLVSSGNAAR